jgi:hypothetical protein
LGAYEDFSNFKSETLLTFGYNEIRMFAVLLQNPHFAGQLRSFLDEEPLAALLIGFGHCRRALKPAFAEM